RAPVGYTLQLQGTWTANIEGAAAATSIVERITWRNLRRVTPTAPGTTRVEASHVAWAEIWEGPGELMVYARRPRPGACLLLQASRAMDGWVLDATTGDELQRVSLVPSSSPAVVELGAHPAVVLVMEIRK
ncbi:MAG: hypothetical protein ACM3NQ_01120, partial [Bacteroidales bacterium]